MQKLLLFLVCLTTSMAWLPPERCAQSRKKDIVPVKAILSTNIEDIATQQHESLKQKYKTYKFYGVPTKISCDDLFKSKISTCDFNSRNCTFNEEASVNLYVPYSCEFYTYDPELLSSVACYTNNCKLSRTVSTVDTYTPAEGYNWGVKISAKASFLDFFEVGGEASTGGAYSCTYTKGKTISDLVECSANPSQSGHLMLYNVKSDMRCDFGTQTYFADWNRNVTHGECIELSTNTFNVNEANKIKESKLDINFEPCLLSLYLLDLDKITDSLLSKLMLGLPLYNPMTDVITMYPDYPNKNKYRAVVLYLKKGTFAHDFKKIIPFTNKAGNSVYQYACIFDSSSVSLRETSQI